MKAASGSDPSGTATAGVPVVGRDTADERVRGVFADIEAVRGPAGVTKTWRFFANDPDLLRLWWDLTGRLEAATGEISPALMHGIAVVCAADVGCPRCFNSHQAALVTQLGIAPELAEALPHFEDTDRVESDWKPVLRLARKVAFGEVVSPEDLAEVRGVGYSDRGIIEITSVAMLESALARRSLAIGHLEEDGEAAR